MRTKLLLLVGLLLLLMTGVTGCSSDTDDITYNEWDISDEDLLLNGNPLLYSCIPYMVNGVKAEPAKIQLMKKKDLPSWLVRLIQMNEVDDYLNWTAVFKGEWNGMTVYYIRESLSSKSIAVYDDKGELAHDVYHDIVGFLRTSKNWALIYCRDVNQYVFSLEVENM